MARPRKSYYWWIIGKALYFFVGLAIFVMTAFLVWRVFFSDNMPGEMEALQPNDRLTAAYGEKGRRITAILPFLALFIFPRRVKCR